MKEKRERKHRTRSKSERERERRRSSERRGNGRGIRSALRYVGRGRQSLQRRELLNERRKDLHGKSGSEARKRKKTIELGTLIRSKFSIAVNMKFDCDSLVVWMRLGPSMAHGSPTSTENELRRIDSDIVYGYNRQPHGLPSLLLSV